MTPQSVPLSLPYTIGARIIDLKREGYEFETSFEGGDYRYTATQLPVARQLVIAV